MKKILFFSVIALSMMIGLQSCSNDDENSGSGVTAGLKLTAEIGGTLNDFCYPTVTYTITNEDGTTTSNANLKAGGLDLTGIKAPCTIKFTVVINKVAGKTADPNTEYDYDCDVNYTVNSYKDGSIYGETGSGFSMTCEGIKGSDVDKFLEDLSFDYVCTVDAKGSITKE